MTILPRRRAWREPPILLQILALLLGGLVVAQFVTLLLTLVLPPAPPAQHDMAGIVAALRGGTERDRLTRTLQSGPPDVSGSGWFTSDQSRHDLALRAGARDGDVRLAFYAPLPFAGIAAPPAPMMTQPAPQPIQPASWHVSIEPFRPLAARLLPINLLLADPGGPPPGGMGGGGFPAGGSAGSGRAGFPGAVGQPRGGLPGGRGAGGPDALRPDQGVRSGVPSPHDLDRQPIGPDPRGADGGASPRGNPGGDDSRDIVGRIGRPIPIEGLDSRSTAPFPQTQPDAQPSPAPQAPTIAAPAKTPTPAAAPPREAAPATLAAPATATPAAPAIRQPAPTTPPDRIDATPLPIAPPSAGLFGLAPAPFVEGDFVAALRLPDGRWAVVQPASEGFPNAWQRRVMLWFGIAFAIVAPIGWLFARHIVRPLARFTAAAEQLGRDPSAAPVALEGPAEIGRAARAFNVMQSRLRSFVDDRTAMVGAISHDLRTPLTRMRFRIEEVEDATIREGMTAEVAEMEAMIASVLSFIRDASTPNARERLDLGLLVEDVAQDAAMIGGRVTVEQVAAAPVEVDVLGMRRLLGNLVENAVKYGECARIRLGIEEDAAVADILDDGPGVPEDELERAFEPFYRASNAARSGKGGSGLGLAVCRSIARAHGGDVRLIRSPEGFAAQLRLPLAHDARPLAA